ncbi:DUF551 domain-containing protein [Escherichia coli]|nr:DUF551 domain-containing protein [Escherichia coli]
MRECRSAGITIDNLEDKCAELAAENAGLKESEREFDKMCAEEFGPDWVSEFTETPATDVFLAEVRAQAFNDLCAVFVTVLELLDELEAAKKRIAELEAEPVSQTYKLNQLSGNSPVTPDGWISCSERMPNDAQWCVVNTEYGYYVQCWSEGQGWLGDDISIPECNVINWMPLPEPPQEMK